MDQVAEISPGSIIPITLLRNEKRMTVQVKIEEYNEGKLLLQ
ncbi:Serine endoprotease DegS [Arsenophonus endosymbiont of Bemisia tabaci Q2]|nr:Serine endoprotease DegS [Arsenophonus endosymbiont of Bemisia tabaci Q2]